MITQRIFSELLEVPFSKFIDINMVPLLFAYGLAFFSAGLAILLQRHKISNFRLAHNLWFLGAFCIIHGVSEWGEVFIPIQGEYLSQAGIDVLRLIQEICWGASFAFLLQFGVSMIAPNLPLVPRVRMLIVLYAPAWSAAVIFVGLFILPDEIGKGFIRYLLTFFGSLLTAAAFVNERHRFAGLYSRSATSNLTIAAGVFGIYAILGGLVVPERGLPVLENLNNENVHSNTGLPIQFWRMVIGVAIAVVVIRTLSIFDLEFRQRLEKAEREQALLEDRQRIGRDLHDGVIQSIYAVGMQLDVATLKEELAPSDWPMVRAKIKSVVVQLNEVIKDIRKYIFNLGPIQIGETNLYNYLKEAAAELTSRNNIDMKIDVTGERINLPVALQRDLAFIVHEALSNVIKHASACSVSVRMDFQDNHLLFEIEDDGVGIDDSTTRTFGVNGGQGLINMAQRAEARGAEFSVSIGRGGIGTLVALNISVPGNDG